MASLDTGAGRRILVVDDDRIIRKHAMALIREHVSDIDIIAEAIDGQHALELLDDVLPGIALVDMRMPRLDGLGFIRAAHERYPWIQFYILSNYDEFEMVKNAFKEGVSDYVLKYELSAGDIQNIIRHGRESLEALCRKQAEEREYARMNKINAMTRCGEAFQRGNAVPACNGRAFWAVWFSVLPKQKSGGQSSLLASIAEICLGETAREAIAFAYPQGADSEILHIGLYVPVLHRNAAVDKLVIQKIASLIIRVLTGEDALFVSVQSKEIHRNDFSKSMDQLKRASETLFYQHESLSLSIDEFEGYGENLPRAEYTAYPLEYAKLVGQLSTEEAVGRLHGTRRALLLDRLRPEEARDILRRYLSALKEEGIDAAIAPAAFDTLHTAVGALEELARRVSEDSPGRYDNEGINRAIRYILAHLGDPLSLNTVAQWSGYSKNHFCRIFKQVTGTSYNAYLNTARMKHAGALIRAGLPVADAARRVGFSDIRYFYRVFEKHMGMTAHKWRESKEV